MELKFDEKGLIPAIVQDHYTKQVLTLAYMNAETLALTIAEGRTVFWSRSRQEIWRKGETSGNVQRVVSITADCDADALVVEVVKDGPACHTGAESCFFNEVYVSSFSSSRLFMPDHSHLVKWIDTHPRFSHDRIFLHFSYTRVTAVLTVIPVIAKYKIFIFSKGNWLRCRHRIVHQFISINV